MQKDRKTNVISVTSCGSNAEAETAWDELEKTIMANIADDISTRILGSHVLITVLKAF